MRVDEGVRARAREVVHGRLLCDVDARVRDSAADVAVAISKAQGGPWTELMTGMARAVVADAPEQRAVAFRLLAALAERVGYSLKPFVRNLVPILHRGLAEPDARMLQARVSALRAAGALIEWASGDSDDLAGLAGLLPDMIRVVGECVEVRQVEAALAGMEVLIDLAEAAPDSLAPHAPAVLSLALAVAMAPVGRMPSSLRLMALTMVKWMVLCLPHALADAEPSLVPRVIDSALAVCVLSPSVDLDSSPDDDDDEEEEEEEELSSRAALRAARAFGVELVADIAETFEPEDVLPFATAFLQRAFGDARSTGGALDVVSVLASAYPDEMEESCGQITPMVVAALADARAGVRESAAMALASFAAQFQPGMSGLHAELVPALMDRAQTDSGLAVRARALLALEALFENAVGDFAAVYVPTLAPALCELVRSAPHAEVAEAAVMCVAALAHASAGAFAPQLQPTLALLLPLVQATNEETTPDFVSVRCRATEAVGVLALHVGWRLFGDDALRAAAQGVLAGLELDYLELREYSFGFFAHLAEAMAGDFAPLAAPVLDRALHGCRRTDGVLVLRDDSDGLTTEEVDEEELKAGGADVTVPESVLLEKAAAVACLGAVLRHVGGVESAARVDAVRETVESLLGLDSVDVRRCAAEAAADVVRFAAREAAEVAEAAGIWATEALSQALVIEEDCGVAVTILRSMVAAVGAVGVGRAAHMVEAHVVPSLVAVLGSTTPCQRDVDDALGVQVVDAAGDAVLALAQLYGRDFGPVFATVAPALSPFLDPAAEEYYGVACGVLAETANCMGAAFAPFCDEAVQALVPGLADESPLTVRNAVFGVGVLVAACPSSNAAVAAARRVLRMAPALAPGRDRSAVTDNIAAALARAVLSRRLSDADVARAVKAVAPYGALDADPDEAAVVCDLFVALLRQPHPDAAPHVGPIMHAFASALPRLSPDASAAVIAVVRHFYSSYPDQMSTLFSQIPHGLRLREAIQAT